MTNSGMPFLDGMPALLAHRRPGDLLNRTSHATPRPRRRARTREGKTSSTGSRRRRRPPTPARPRRGAPQVALARRARPIGSAAQLETDFEALVVGVHRYGCGIESQLETWYRFLVQPDPYDSIVRSDSRWPRRVERRRRDDHPAAPRLPAPRLARRHHRPDRRERLGDRRPLLRRPGLQVHGPDVPAAAAARRRARRTRQSHGAPRARAPGTASDSDCNRVGPYTAAERLGLLHQPPPRPHAAEVRHRPAVPARALRPRPDEPDGARPRPRVPGRRQQLPGRHRCPRRLRHPTSRPDRRRPQLHEPALRRDAADGSDRRPRRSATSPGQAGRGRRLVFYAHIGGVPHQLLQTTPGDSTGLCTDRHQPRGLPAEGHPAVVGLDEDPRHGLGDAADARA